MYLFTFRNTLPLSIFSDLGRWILSADGYTSFADSTFG